MTSDQIVTVRGLGKEYAGGLMGRTRKTALEDVSFTVHNRSIFALIGPNGAGKSTTIHLMLGFLRPTAGSIRIRDHAPSSPHSRRSLGFLPEVFAFDPFTTGRRLLERFCALARLDASTCRTYVEDALRGVDLAGDAERKVGTYSKGMTQRIGLAQALLGDPELLILDEPMSGMDPASRRSVKDLLLKRRSYGRATILSSHVLSDIEELADHVLILNRGRVLADGPLNELQRPSQVKRVVFEIAAGVPIDERLQSLVSRSKSGNDHRTRSMEVSGDGELNSVLGILTNAGARIVSVNATSDDLEALFLALTEADRTKANS